MRTERTRKRERERARTAREPRKQTGGCSIRSWGGIPCEPPQSAASCFFHPHDEATTRYSEVVVGWCVLNPVLVAVAVRLRVSGESSEEGQLELLDLHGLTGHIKAKETESSKKQVRSAATCQRHLSCFGGRGRGVLLAVPSGLGVRARTAGAQDHEFEALKQG